MNIIETIIIPTVTGVLGGVGGFLFQRFYESRLSGEGGTDFRQYSGVWRGLHVTADPKTGKPAYSEHLYRLSVDKRGCIKGELSDLIGEPPWEYAVSGQIASDSSRTGCELHAVRAAWQGSRLCITGASLYPTAILALKHRMRESAWSAICCVVRSVIGEHLPLITASHVLY
jgi:hypothetical protein